MEFGPINLVNGIFVALILVPNILYAVKYPRQENLCTNPAVNLLEQIGRYASMALMILPMGAGKFGFPSVGDFLIYAIGNTGLLVAYWLVWPGYFHRVTRRRVIALAMLPTCIFLLTGLTLRHWSLVLADMVFGWAHLYITLVNHRE